MPYDFWMFLFHLANKTRKCGTSVYFWNVSDNGFRVNDSVPNNNIVLAGESNLIWIRGNIQTVLYLSVLTFKKHSNSRREAGSCTKLSSRVASFHTCVPPSPDSSFTASQTLWVSFFWVVPPSTLEMCRCKCPSRHALWLVKVLETILPVSLSTSP